MVGYVLREYVVGVRLIYGPRSESYKSSTKDCGSLSPGAIPGSDTVSIRSGGRAGLISPNWFSSILTDTMAL